MNLPHRLRSRLTRDATAGRDTESDSDRDAKRATFGIAIAIAIGSMSFNFWYPFMPLYLLRIGAKSEADALFWVAVATTIQGVARLLTGPFWGVLSDRMGRKVMLLRALYLAAPTTVIAALVNAPWQISIALTFQGLFSGFIPAAVALTTVSVPEHRMNSALGTITGAQYLGTTVGPALGAVLAGILGFRGAILFAAAALAVAATLVLVIVPSDQPAKADRPPGPRPPLEPFNPTPQFVLVIFYFFVIFSMTQLVRLATPIALKQIDGGNVEGITGVAFTLAGLASAVSVLFVAPNFFKPGRMRHALIAATIACGLAYLLLALADSVPTFVFFFVIISLLQAALIPPTNSLIAGNVPRSRRGTAFGWAGSAQAVAFAVGPMGAAFFAAVSLDLGFVVLAALFVATAVLLLAIREPGPAAGEHVGQPIER